MKKIKKLEAEMTATPATSSSRRRRALRDQIEQLRHQAFGSAGCAGRVRLRGPLAIR